MCMLLCVIIRFSFTISPRVLSVRFVGFFVFCIFSIDLALVIVGGFVFWFGCSLLFFFLNF